MAKKDRASLNKSTERFEEYFKEDLVTVEELIVAIEDLSGEIEHLEEIIEELKVYKEQYCELKKDSGY